MQADRVSWRTILRQGHFGNLVGGDRLSLGADFDRHLDHGFVTDRKREDFAALLRNRSIFKMGVFNRGRFSCDGVILGHRLNSCGLDRSLDVGLDK